MDRQVPWPGLAIPPIRGRASSWTPAPSSKGHPARVSPSFTPARGSPLPHDKTPDKGLQPSETLPPGPAPCLPLAPTAQLPRQAVHLPSPACRRHSCASLHGEATSQPLEGAPAATAGSRVVLCRQDLVYMCLPHVTAQGTQRPHLCPQHRAQARAQGALEAGAHCGRSTPCRLPLAGPAAVASAMLPPP